MSSKSPTQSDASSAAALAAAQASNPGLSIEQQEAFGDLATKAKGQALTDAAGGKFASTIDQSGDLNNSSNPSQNVTPPTDPNAAPDLSAMTNAGSAMNSQTYARSRAATILTSGRGLLGTSARTLLGR